MLLLKPTSSVVRMVASALGDFSRVRFSRSSTAWMALASSLFSSRAKRENCAPPELLGRTSQLVTRKSTSLTEASSRSSTWLIRPVSNR